MVLMIGATGFSLMLFQGSMLQPSLVLGGLCAYAGVRRMHLAAQDSIKGP